jgi:hypothetical protein
MPHILVFEQDENQLNICTNILQKAKLTTASDEK